MPNANFTVDQFRSSESGRVPHRFRQIVAALLPCIALLSAPPATAQSSPKHESTVTSALRGHVQDSTGKPAADAVVFLDHTTEVPGKAGTPTQAVVTERVHTNGLGAYSFPNLAAGAYTLHAERTASERTANIHVVLAPNDAKAIDLAFVPAQSSEPPASASPQPDASSSTKAPEFFDEPHFTIAGVMQATNLGGHGSDNALRTSEALVKATGSLAPETTEKTNAAPAGKETISAETLRQQKAVVQARIAPDSAALDSATRQEQGDFHHQLAQLDEKLGDPLAAVHEYQRAAELAPTETHLFDWATELLTHRAPEAATEVFEQGVRLYPQSVRMLLGLGVSWYARRSDEKASHYLAAASDLAPDDPTPYLFLGRMLTAETVPLPEVVDRLARFVRLEPEYSMSNYYYALALSKRAQLAGAMDQVTSAKIETLLQYAVRLDPKLAAAYLQLGVLQTQRGDYARAITSYQQAIAVSPELEEAHYRLAQAYRRTGDAANAQKELALHEELAKKSKEAADRQPSEIQQFVVSLREEPSPKN